MAAGLGFKDFVTGEVLTAADVDGYLMQGVWVFASAAARDAAVTSPQEGNFAYLKDTNVTTYYTGSAWANLDTTGMTNPMTTTGDTIYSSSGSTPARLGIGSTGQVLTVAAGIPSWSTPAAGGFTFTTWTPTFTNITVGNGSYTARYGTSGKFTHFEISFKLGSTSSISNGAQFTLPTTPKTTSNAIDQYTFATYLDSGTAINFGAAELTATTCDLYIMQGSPIGRAGVSATQPFTWGTDDEFFIAGDYEEA